MKKTTKNHQLKFVAVKFVVPVLLDAGISEQRFQDFLNSEEPYSHNVRHDAVFPVSVKCKEVYTDYTDMVDTCQFVTKNSSETIKLQDFLVDEFLEDIDPQDKLLDDMEAFIDELENEPDPKKPVNCDELASLYNI